MDAIFTSVLGTTESTMTTATGTGFMICTIASILLGLIGAFIYMYRHDYSKNFVITLALLPVIVQMVITLVNGNIGAGVAVMGVFNLVRFRSIAGTAKDIGSVFLAMAIGLATGMGYIGIAAMLTVVVGVFNIIYVVTPFGKSHESSKLLKITVPEDLEFEGVFDDVLAGYTRSFELQNVMTTNMGSLYQLEYKVSMKEQGLEKRMIDELRCLNGNLKISLGSPRANREVL
ncbi:MAG TPA: DUF4956 domain-containing protein [Eggerthellaceae bacterium]|nr:DUF4956 domain-containing protein [Eggerthellaceae bacterium]